MQFQSMKKNKECQTAPYGKVNSSITESTSHHSYISFKTPQTDPKNLIQTELPNKRQKFLNVISKPQAKNIHQPQTPQIKVKNREGFLSLEGFCTCIAKSEESSYIKIKQAKRSRQDLSSLLTSKVEEKQQENYITPINSLLNLLDQ